MKQASENKNEAVGQSSNRVRAPPPCAEDQCRGDKQASSAARAFLLCPAAKFYRGEGAQTSFCHNKHTHTRAQTRISRQRKTPLKVLPIPLPTSSEHIKQSEAARVKIPPPSGLPFFPSHLIASTFKGKLF